MMKQIHMHTALVHLIPLSSISKNYMQWQSPVKGENDQHFPAIISPM